MTLSNQEINRQDNKHDQLIQSSKRWSEEQYVAKYEDYYRKESFNEIRLRDREKKALEFLDGLNLKQGAKVLELGFGPGVTSSKIVRRGHHLFGIDISEPFRQMATKYCSQVPGGKFNLLVGNAEKLDFPENTFDCVLELGLLQYLESPESCAREAYRVLKKNGFFIVGQYNNYSVSSLDNPYHFPKTIITALSGRKHLFRYRDTFLLDLAILATKLLRIQKINARLLSHKKVGKVKKNIFHYQKLKSLLEDSGFTVVKIAAVDFRSKVWRRWYPEKVNAFFQQWNDKRSQPLKFANTFVFLAQKK